MHGVIKVVHVVILLWEDYSSISSSVTFFYTKFASLIALKSIWKLKAYFQWLGFFFFIDFGHRSRGEEDIACKGLWTGWIWLISIFSKYIAHYVKWYIYAFGSLAVLVLIWSCCGTPEWQELVLDVLLM